VKKDTVGFHVAMDDVLLMKISKNTKKLHISKHDENYKRLVT